MMMIDDQIEFQYFTTNVVWKFGSFVSALVRFSGVVILMAKISENCEYSNNCKIDCCDFTDLWQKFTGNFIETSKQNKLMHCTTLKSGSIQYPFKDLSKVQQTFVCLVCLCVPFLPICQHMFWHCMHARRFPPQAPRNPLWISTAKTYVCRVRWSFFKMKIKITVLKVSLIVVPLFYEALRHFCLLNIVGNMSL